MAISMSAKSSTAVLTVILVNDPQAQMKLDYVTKAGAVVTVGLFTFTITVGKIVHTKTMPSALSSYAHSAPSVQKIIFDNVCSVIESALLEVGTAGPKPAAPVGTTFVIEDIVAPTPAIPSWMSVSPPAKEIDAVLKAVEEANAAGVKGVIKVAKLADTKVAKAKPTDDVVKLKDARALSQKVSGTSGGSIYRAVAIGSLNIAVREHNNTASIRAEFQGTRDNAVASKLSALGFTDSNSYLSMHVTLANVPVMRVVGSIILGAELEFDAIATTKEQFNA